jgi:hypothetical protein
LDGRVEAIPLDRISEFISEAQNPENSKHAALMRVELPSMERYRGIRKVDVLDEGERIQVKDFVQKQLARYWSGCVPVFPYPVRPGFEHLREQLDESLLSHAHAKAVEQRAAILRHKVVSLVGECADYLDVALRAAGTADSKREQLRQQILGQKASLDDTRLAFRLIVRHAAATARSTFEEILRKDEQPLRERTLAGLDSEFPAWTRRLNMVIERFDNWLSDGMTRGMAELSKRHRSDFVESVHRVSRLLFERRAVDVVFMNLSRLASQWQEIVSGALLSLEKESMRRLDGLVTTIESLIAVAGQEAPRIREDLDGLESLRTKGLSTEG